MRASELVLSMTLYFADDAGSVEPHVGMLVELNCEVSFRQALGSEIADESESMAVLKSRYRDHVAGEARHRAQSVGESAGPTKSRPCHNLTAGHRGRRCLCSQIQRKGAASDRRTIKIH